MPRHVIPCNSRVIENFVPSLLATLTRDYESTRFTRRHARDHPSAHSCEIKMGPSALTQEVSCNHVIVVGQHRCQQNVNGEEVNAAGLLDNELKGEEVNTADHAITLNCCVTSTDHFTRENLTSAVPGKISPQPRSRFSAVSGVTNTLENQKSYPDTISPVGCVRGNRHFNTKSPRLWIFNFLLGHFIFLFLV